ncbi:MAG: Mur ligase family protein [Dehalococcoidia bacterium]|nr:Mur ligase family protein [Dehalococcoidia bacterium]
MAIRFSPRRAGAVVAGKIAGRLSRVMERGGGTALPGLLAYALDKRMVSALTTQIPQGSVIVTGTNGKTTTSRMIATILREAGLNPLHNSTGSNLMRGVATTLLDRTGISGNLQVGQESIGLFEVDEAVIPLAIREVKPKIVVFNNLFRDQLDRYGEVDSIAQKWCESLLDLPGDAKVVLNADDPLVASLGEVLGDRAIYFGIDDLAQGTGGLGHAADSKWCPRCRIDFRYSVSFYGHLGHYECPNCGLHRPRPGIAAELVASQGFAGSDVRVRTPSGNLTFRVGLPGLYNVYNSLAALATSCALGLPLATAKRALEKVTAAFGRVERVEMDGKSLYLLLVKNPLGCNEVLRALFADGQAKDIMLILNDKIADGRDVSWIWDVDFERMAGNVNSVVASGVRAADLALRLKYAGLFEDQPQMLLVEKNIERALRLALDRVVPGGTLFVLPTYTSMLEIRSLLAKTGFLMQYWEQE